MRLQRPGKRAVYAGEGTLRPSLIISWGQSGDGYCSRIFVRVAAEQLVLRDVAQKDAVISGQMTACNLEKFR
jgi:hypothetical protein